MTDDERELLLLMAQLLMQTTIEGDDELAAEADKFAEEVRRPHDRIRADSGHTYRHKVTEFLIGRPN